MDWLAVTKASTYGGIWSSHAGPRAHNSRGAQHVGQKGNVQSCGVKLLRLNSTGEVSSDDKCPNLFTPASVMAPHSPPTETASGKMMGYFNSMMPFSGKQFQLPAQYSTPKGTDSLSTLVNMYSSKQNSTMPEKMFEPSFANDGLQSNIINKVMTIFPSRQLILNNFNRNILETSCKNEADLSSPWNKFYTNWKEKNNPDFTMGWENESGRGNSNKDKMQSKQPSPNSTKEHCLLEYTVYCPVPSVPFCEQTGSKDIQMEMKPGCSNKDMLMSGIEKDKDHPVEIHTSCDLVDPIFIIPCTDENVLTDKTVPHSCDNNINMKDIEKKTGVLNNGEIEISMCNLASTNHNMAQLLDSDRCSKKSKRNKVSAKRQRRLKARRRQNCSSLSSETAANSDCLGEKNTTTDTDQNETSLSESSDDGQKPVANANPLSFILGITDLDSDSPHGSHKSYKVSMLVDREDSVFSEDDPDSESDSFDFSYRCDFLPNGGDLFNPLNFTVSISRSPSTPDHNVPSSPLFPNNSYLDDINECWKLSISSPKCKSKSTKKVTFAPEKELAVVHPIIAWDYAYRAARKGPWEEYGRDRQRFLRRVEETEILLASIFDPNHRLATLSKSQLNNSPASNCTF